jgi:hypothetical protein
MRGSLFAHLTEPIAKSWIDRNAHAFGAENALNHRIEYDQSNRNVPNTLLE